MKQRLGFFAPLLLIFALCGCQPGTQREILPIPALGVAVASFTQPAATTELLAGSLPEDRHPAPATDLQTLDGLLRSALTAETARSYIFLPPKDYLRPLQRDRQGKRSSLATWTWHAKQAGAPLILVPQVLQWPGGSANYAALDFFLIDARENGQLLQRLKFEYQEARGQELFNLIQADIGQVIKEFGL